MFARARGWTGQTSGNRRATSRRIASDSRSAAASSTFDGRWSVTTPYPAAPSMRSRGDARARQRFGGRDRPLPVPQQRVDHHVADEADARVGNAFAPQVVGGRAFRRVQALGNLVGQHAIDLLRHLPVEAAQAGLDVDDGNALLHRDQAAGERRIDVADDDDAARPQLVHHGLESPHDFRRLHRVRSRSDFEVHVRRRQFEIREQPLVHRDVVVLSRVDEDHARQLGPRRERAHQRRHLHVVRPRADDARDRPRRVRRTVHQCPAGVPGFDGRSGCRSRCSRSTAADTVRSSRSIRSSR